jgi:hypothetical protein
MKLKAQSKSHRLSPLRKQKVHKEIASRESEVVSKGWIFDQSKGAFFVQMPPLNATSLCRAGSDAP